MATLFIEVLRCYVRAGKFKINEFVVMRNHVHLLVTLGAEMSVEKAMQLIKGNFSFRAKTELGFLGEIWQRGFSDVRIKDEESFRAHQLYIYNNPVKAGLASVPEEYPAWFFVFAKAEGAGAKARSRNRKWRHDQGRALTRVSSTSSAGSPEPCPAQVSVQKKHANPGHQAICRFNFFRAWEITASQPCADRHAGIAVHPFFKNCLVQHPAN